jgi:hypothetical protein
MQYQVTVSTSMETITEYRLLCSIRANDIESANEQITNTNNRYPDWDMQLHNDTAFPDNFTMPIGLIDKKGLWIKKYPDWASLSTFIQSNAR